MKNKKFKKGFTLIEILVVVLIIGILAAIALPQYQVAVLKSEVSRVAPVVRAIGNAEEIYFLAHGRFSSSLDELDITINPPKGWECDVDNSGSTRNQNNRAYCTRTGDQIGVHYWFDTEVNIPELYRNLHCWTRSDNARNKRVCSSFGPLLVDRYGNIRYYIQ